MISADRIYLRRRSRMKEQDDAQNTGREKTAAENLNEMIGSFGEAIGQIFNDPALKEKAKELGRAARESAETLGQRLKDEEVKAKFRDVGKAARAFGKNVADAFAEEDKRKSGEGGPVE